MSQTQEEEATIKSAQNGNQEAIEYLINQNMDIVFAKAKYFFIKGLDKDDVIQEGRVGLYKAIRDYDINKESSFRGFIQLCIHRQLISAIKKANRQKHMPLNYSTSMDKKIRYQNMNGRSFNEIIPDENENLEEKFLNKEFLSLVFSDLKKELTELEWKVFLQYLDSRSYKEISHILKINLKTVDNALQRTRKKIERLKTNYEIHGYVG